MGGVLERAYKGPSGPGNVTPPGMETRGRRNLAAMDAGDTGPIDAGGVPVPTSGAQTPGQRPRRGGGIFNQAKSAIQQRRDQIEADRAAKYPTTSPGVGETAYRPGFTDKDAARIAKDKRRANLAGMTKRERKAFKRDEVMSKLQERGGLFGKKKKGSIWDKVREANEARQAGAQEPERQAFDPMLGVKESLGEAYVDPAQQAATARRGFAQPEPRTGGNVSRGTPKRRGSAASRSRRDIR